ncbi:hypothetical protein GCM10022252_49300 [Streptosporangium oxazolinicum]|uniref:Uncharacterized protein n=1 Tax=Streptosporangium oxazolinicum TaxID=909287 RepID=A0ABP8B6X3_9ACTN
MAYAEQVGPPVTTRLGERLHRTSRIGTGALAVSVHVRKIGTTIGRHPDVAVSTIPIGATGPMPAPHPGTTVSTVPTRTTGPTGPMLASHPDTTASTGPVPGRHPDVVLGVRIGSARLSFARQRRFSRRSQRRRHIAEPSSARRRTGPSQ